MRSLGPSSTALAQSYWSLLLMALVIGPFLGRIASYFLIEFLVGYLAEISLLDYDCLTFLPSIVAASIIFVARFMIWPEVHSWVNVVWPEKVSHTRTGGRNRGRVGVINNREKHKGSFETIHVQDSTGHEFATRMGNVFTIGKGTKPWISLPKVEHESNIDSIEESMIYDLVFSENYASSTWCLDELTKILDCKKRYGRVVIPVFYKVDPSIVRNQKETYAEVFFKHEHRFEDKIDKVHAWKSALTEACVSNSIKFIFTTSTKSPSTSINPSLKRPQQQNELHLQNFVVPGKPRSKRKRLSAPRTNKDPLSIWSHHLNPQNEALCSDPPYSNRLIGWQTVNSSCQSQRIMRSNKKRL
ncbi:40S ribosomal protein S4 [Glycine soja]|uniref:40S ribosomal protein S4 n=1 Tax=Glycine soja TaxID=3848 RepID=A0A445L9K6_GLYSO|nr:40S ribosomal protein S4 [Glycine soja]